jgi:hypothetical protein
MTPQPITTAPRDENVPLLLYCPEQNGLQVGISSGDGWIDNLLSYVALSPSRWCVLPDPSGGAR